MSSLNLKLEQLTRSFQNRRVIKAESLHFQGPGLLILSGDNGSGKTTLLRILSTLILPDSGDAWICGDSVTKAPDSVKKNIGYLSSTENSFFPRLNGEENLLLFGHLYGLEESAVAKKIEKLKGSLKLDSVLSTPYLAASSGMKQSLALARALLCDPAVLLLDEPTRNLDRNAAEQFREFLREEAKTKLILLATHIDADTKNAHAIWSIRNTELTEDKR